MNLVHNRKKKEKKKKKKKRIVRRKYANRDGQDIPLPFLSPPRLFRIAFFASLYSRNFDELLFFRKILLRFGVLEDRKFENLSLNLIDIL